MSAIKLNEFPSDAFRAYLANIRKQLELISMECSDEVQLVESRRPVVSNRLDQLDAQEASFADRLSKLLIEKNITQEELAHRIGCTQSAISKMLTRNARPRRTTIIKLSEALKVEPTELWPQLEVAAILDSVANAFADVELTPEQAKSLEAASLRSPARVKIRELPSRKRS
jgi:transcriptional regulator with XRE-family HTH domain